MVSPQSRDTKNLPHLQNNSLGYAEEGRQSPVILSQAQAEWWPKGYDLRPERDLMVRPLGMVREALIVTVVNWKSADIGGF